MYVSSGYNNPIFYFCMSLANSFEAKIVSAFYAVKEAINLHVHITHLTVVLDNSVAVNVFNLAVRCADFGMIYQAAPNLRHEVAAAIIPVIYHAAKSFTSLIALHVPAHTAHSDDLSCGNREADRLASCAHEIAALPSNETSNVQLLPNPAPGSLSLSSVTPESDPALLIPTNYRIL